MLRYATKHKFLMTAESYCMPQYHCHQELGLYRTADFTVRLNKNNLYYSTEYEQNTIS